MASCCTLEHIALGVACPACIEIVAAFGRAATEAGLRPGMTDVSSNLAGPALKRQAGSFGVASVAACTARPALSVSHMDNAQGTSCVPLPKLRQVSR